MPVTYEQLLEKANQLAKNLQVEEVEGKYIYCREIAVKILYLIFYKLFRSCKSLEAIWSQWWWNNSSQRSWEIPI